MRCLRVHMHVHTQNTETSYTGFSGYIHVHVGRDNVSIAINGRVESTTLYYQCHIYYITHSEDFR